MLTQQSNTLMLSLAWAYVIMRIAHAAVHLGPNKLRWQIRAHSISWLVLLAMWVDLVAGVAQSQ